MANKKNSGNVKRQHSSNAENAVNDNGSKHAFRLLRADTGELTDIRTSDLFPKIDGLGDAIHLGKRILASRGMKLDIQHADHESLSFSIGHQGNNGLVANMGWHQFDKAKVVSGSELSRSVLDAAIKTKGPLLVIRTVGTAQRDLTGTVESVASNIAYALMLHHRPQGKEVAS